jgi:sigma-B regulation protein RsbU (phosphoserine phosphatase)
MRNNIIVTRFMQDRGIGFKLCLAIMAGVVVIFTSVFGYNYYVSRQIIAKNIEKNATSLARATVNQIDTVLRSVEKVPQNLSFLLPNPSSDRSEIERLLRIAVQNNTEIYGAAVAFEPYAFDPAVRAFSPYIYKADQDLKAILIPYDYFTWDWYQTPKTLDRPVWSEPYFDKGAGGVIMATYSVPFYQTGLNERRFMGVMTADVSLSWLREIVSSIRIARTGYAFLLSKTGTFVTHPDPNLVMKETIFRVAEAGQDPRLRELGSKMTRGESGFVPFQSLLTKKPCWLAYVPLSTSGWSLGVLFPQDELMTDLTRLNRTVFFLSLAGFFLILVVIVWIAKSITKPLRDLSGVTEDIARGHLDVHIPQLQARDEVGKLAHAFETMGAALKQYIQELTETTAAKGRIESELRIAHDIQMGILPKVFPPFPERRELDIYATLIPAKEVGGDLYDFFFLDEDLLCFAVGDVSGKGVPASLFMAITRTLVRTKASKRLSPDMILTRVNQALSLDNPSLMFVTLFLGMLNLRTGEMEYSSGGHNPPYLLRVTGDIERLEPTQGVALGVMEDSVYHSKRTPLYKGDSIFLYTDGVTEATNQDEALFSEERLFGELISLRDRPLKESIDILVDRIKTFSGNAPQSDDITLMRLIFKGCTAEFSSDSLCEPSPDI